MSNREGYILFVYNEGNAIASKQWISCADVNAQIFYSYAQTFRTNAQIFRIYAQTLMRRTLAYTYIECIRFNAFMRKIPAKIFSAKAATHLFAASFSCYYQAVLFFLSFFFSGNECSLSDSEILVGN